MSTSGMDRRPFEGRHLVKPLILIELMFAPHVDEILGQQRTHNTSVRCVNETFRAKLEQFKMGAHGLAN